MSDTSGTGTDGGPGHVCLLAAVPVPDILSPSGHKHQLDWCNFHACLRFLVLLTLQRNAGDTLSGGPKLFCGTLNSNLETVKKKPNRTLSRRNHAGNRERNTITHLTETFTLEHSFSSPDTSTRSLSPKRFLQTRTVIKTSTLKNHRDLFHFFLQPSGSPLYLFFPGPSPHLLLFFNLMCPPSASSCESVPQAWPCIIRRTFFFFARAPLSTSILLSAIFHSSLGAMKPASSNYSLNFMQSFLVTLLSFPSTFPPFSFPVWHLHFLLV